MDELPRYKASTVFENLGNPSPNPSVSGQISYDRIFDIGTYNAFAASGNDGEDGATGPKGDKGDTGGPSGQAIGMGIL